MAPAEELLGRPKSPVAIGAVLDATARLVDETPFEYVAEPCVFVALQRLQNNVDEVIRAAEFVRYRPAPRDDSCADGLEQLLALMEAGESSSSQGRSTESENG